MHLFEGLCKNPQDGVEEHRQIPLEYGAVANAAKETGLSIVGAYANRNFVPIGEETKRIHFVLKG